MNRCVSEKGLLWVLALPWRSKRLLKTIISDIVFFYAVHVSSNRATTSDLRPTRRRPCMYHFCVPPVLLQDHFIVWWPCRMGRGFCRKESLDVCFWRTFMVCWSAWMAFAFMRSHKMISFPIQVGLWIFCESAWWCIIQCYFERCILLRRFETIHRAQKRFWISTIFNERTAVWLCVIAN